MPLSAIRLLSLLPLVAGAVAGALFLLPGLSDGTSAYAAIASVEALLPLVGLGVLLGQLPRRWAMASMLCLVLGSLAGLWYRETAYGWMAPVPGAAPHLFLAGPIVCALVGFALILSPRFRPIVCLPVFALAGMALAIATRLGDPVLFAEHYRWSAPLLQALTMLSIAWPASQIRNSSFTIATRIGGSWVLAVALLYGGAFLAGRETHLTPPDFPPLPRSLPSEVLVR